MSFLGILPVKKKKIFFQLAVSGNLRRNTEVENSLQTLIDSLNIRAIILTFIENCCISANNNVQVENDLNVSADLDDVLDPVNNSDKNT